MPMIVIMIMIMTCGLWPRWMINGKIWMLGLRFMVVIISWGLNCFIRNVSVIVIIIIIVPFLHFWNVCPTQGCDDISVWMYCHNLFSGASSFNIQNAMIGVWSFIIMFTYKSNCCLNNGLPPSSNSTCERVFNKWLKMIHWNYHSDYSWPYINFKYWGWSKFESHFVDFSSLITLRLEGLGFTTWGALVLVIVHGPTPSSNVISPRSSTTILGGLTNGSICMFKMFISIRCVWLRNDDLS